MASNLWYVYMVRCADSSLYTGIAMDLERRVAEHNGEAAAKYTRSRQPVVLVYSEKVDSRSEACRRELLIKGLSKQQKEALVQK